MSEGYVEIVYLGFPLHCEKGIPEGALMVRDKRIYVCALDYERIKRHMKGQALIEDDRLKQAMTELLGIIERERNLFRD